MKTPIQRCENHRPANRPTAIIGRSRASISPSDSGYLTCNVGSSSQNGETGDDLESSNSGTLPVVEFPRLRVRRKDIESHGRCAIRAIVCMGYFTIVKQCVGNQDAKLSERTGQVIRLVGERAIKIGLDIGMSNEAILARSSASKEKQLALMQHGCATIKPVSDRYGNRCKEVLLHQDAVLKEYLKSGH